MPATFTITVPGGTVQLSGNPILVVGTTTTTGKTDHKLLCKVTCTDGAIAGGPWIDSITPLAGAATFDISGLVDTNFIFSFSTDIASPAKVFEHDQLAATVTVDIGESYIDTDGSLVEMWKNAPYTINVLKGGLSNYMLGVMAEENETFYSNYISLPHFLTLQPANITLPSSSNMKLWFIPDANRNCSVTCKAYYSDTSSVEQSFSQAFSATKLYEINTNLAHWGDITPTNNDCPMVCYIIIIAGGSWFDTVIITPDTAYHETQNDFYYANQLGGIDLVVCTGELSENPTTSGDSYMKTLAVSPASTVGTKFYDRKTVSRKYKCNTGFQSLTIRRTLLDFFMSQYCWWRTDRFGVPNTLNTGFGLVPINIIPGSYEIDTTSEDLKAVEFEFEIAHSDKFI